MPRVKPKRTTPRLDMTPMVDLAFLLVTFFMLTTKFRAQEPVVVDMPPSHSEIPLPKDNMVISIAKDGKVYFDMDNKYNREDLLKRIGQEYNIPFTDDEVNTFSNLGSFGMPIGSLKEFLDMPTESRNKVTQTGIPIDSAHNELEKWVLDARLVNQKLRIAIKGDRNTHYEVMKKVFSTIQGKPMVNRFNLLTNLEAGPVKTSANNH